MLRIKGHFLPLVPQTGCSKDSERSIVAGRVPTDPRCTLSRSLRADQSHRSVRHAELCHIFPQILCDKAHKILPHIPACRRNASEAPGSVSQYLPDRYPGCRRASSRSPWSPAEPLQIRTPPLPACAAIATSRPLISLPSVSMRTLLRSPFIIRCLMRLRKTKLPRKSRIVDGACTEPHRYRRHSRRSG